MKKVLTFVFTAVVSLSAFGAALTVPFGVQVDPTNLAPVAPAGSRFWPSNAPAIKTAIGFGNSVSNHDTRTVEFPSGILPTTLGVGVAPGTILPDATLVIGQLGAMNIGYSVLMTMTNTTGKIAQLKAHAGAGGVTFSATNAASTNLPVPMLDLYDTNAAFGGWVSAANGFIGNFIGNPAGLTNLQVMRVFDVTDFGASVADSIDDTVATTNAFYRLTNGGVGGVLYVPPGVQTLQSTQRLYIDQSAGGLLGTFGASKVKVQGASRGASAITFSKLTNSVAIQAKTGMPELQDISILALASPGSTGFLSTNNGLPTTWHNVLFDGWDVGAKFDPIADGQIYGGIFNNNRIGLWLPGYADDWIVNMRGDHNSLTALMLGAPTSIDGTTKRVLAGEYYVSGVDNKHCVILGAGYGNFIRSSSEQGAGPVVALGRPPVYFGMANTDAFVGTVKLGNFYSLDNGASTSVSSLTRSGTTATATIASSIVSNLFIGQEIQIAGATPSGYNGTWPISAIPSTTTIQYVMPSDPGSSGSGTIICYVLWPYAEAYAPVEQVIFENGSPGNAVFFNSKTNTADSSVVSFAGIDARAMGQTTNGALFRTSAGLKIRPSESAQTVFNGMVNGAFEYFYPSAWGTNIVFKYSSNGVYAARSTSSDFVGNAANLTNAPPTMMPNLASAAVQAAGTYVYDNDASNYFARAVTLTFGEKMLVNQMVLSLKAAGFWTNKFNGFLPGRGGTANSCAQNLITNSFNVTWSGTVAFGTNGMTSSNNDATGNTGFLPSSNGGGIMTQNSAHFYVYNRTQTITNNASNLAVFGGTYGNNNTKSYLGTDGSTSLYGQGPNDTASQGTDNGINVSSDYRGHMMMSRTASTANALYFNNLSATNTTASTALPDLNLVLFRRYPAGDMPFNGTLQVVTWGAGFTAAEYATFKTIMDAYIVGVSNLTTQAGAFMPREETQKGTAAVYAAGTAAALTGSTALLTFGTTSPSITITNAGTYLIYANAGLKYNAATYDATAGRTATIKLRRTNNTAADLSNASRVVNLRPSITTFTDNAGMVPVPPVIYTATAGDVIELWGVLSATPSAGSVDATSGEIVYVKVY